MKILVALLASILLLTSCEFQQDPMTGVPDRVKNGQLPAEKPEPAKPVDKRLLTFESPQKVDGRVGVPLEFKIKGRALLPDLEYKIIINNIADFPGATYDAQTGDFRWVPNREKVAGYPSADFDLNISIESIKSEKYPVVNFEEKSISIVVVNEYQKPLVNSVTVKPFYVTGSDALLAITMEDLDAIGPSDIRFGVQECSTWLRKSLSHLVQIEGLKRDGTTSTFKGTLRLRLGDIVNLPTGSYCFNVNITSKFGVMSDNTKVDLDLEAKLKDSVTTLSDFNVNVGERAQFAFSIFEPNGNGEVSLAASTDDVTQVVSPGSSLKCSRSTMQKYQLDCFMIVDATGLPARSSTLKVVVNNVSTRSSQSVSTQHKLKINVKAANP